MIRFICLLLFFTVFILPVFALEKDKLADELQNKNLEKPLINTNYNYENTTKIPIKLRITKSTPTQRNIPEGSYLEFIVQQDVKYNDKVLARKGDICTARVETTISNGMNGIPASIIIGDFSLNGLDKNKLTTSYEKFGLDLSLLVFPIKWALTPFPPTGSATNFIFGGYAKIKPSNLITIYYCP